jgi:hypothetical protein
MQGCHCTDVPATNCSRTGPHRQISRCRGLSPAYQARTPTSRYCAKRSMHRFHTLLHNQQHIHRKIAHAYGRPGARRSKQTVAICSHLPVTLVSCHSLTPLAIDATPKFLQVAQGYVADVRRMHLRLGKYAHTTAPCGSVCAELLQSNMRKEKSKMLNPQTYTMTEAIDTGLKSQLRKQQDIKRISTRTWMPRAPAIKNGTHL